MIVKSEPVITEKKLELIAHSGSGVDSWIILTFLHNWCKLFNPINHARGLIILQFSSSFHNVEKNYEKTTIHVLLCSMNRSK